MLKANKIRVWENDKGPFSENRVTQKREFKRYISAFQFGKILPTKPPSNLSNKFIFSGLNFEPANNSMGPHLDIAFLGPISQLGMVQNPLK